MRIQVNQREGFFTLRPTNGEEYLVLCTLRDELATVSDHMEYGGRETDENGWSTKLKFKRPKRGTFELVPSGKRDREALFVLRNGLYFGATGLTYGGSEGQRLADLKVYFTLAKCRVCQHDMVRLEEVTWKVCNRCKRKCSHKWLSGEGMGSPGLDRYCSKCGTGDYNGQLRLTPHYTYVFHYLEGLREHGVAVGIVSRSPRRN